CYSPSPLRTPAPLPPPRLPYTTLFRSRAAPAGLADRAAGGEPAHPAASRALLAVRRPPRGRGARPAGGAQGVPEDSRSAGARPRSEEHTSELQSPYDLVCRLLLEKKNN